MISTLTKPRRRVPMTRGRAALIAGLTALAGLAVANNLHDAGERRLDREPLWAAQLAAKAMGQTVVTVAGSVAARWEGTTGPSRSVAEQYVGPGNALLAPAFYASFTRDGSPAPATPATWNCLYLALQPGGGSFDATRVYDITQVCYLRGSDAAISSAETRVVT